MIHMLILFFGDLFIGVYDIVGDLYLDLPKVLDDRFQPLQRIRELVDLVLPVVYHLLDGLFQVLDAVPFLVDLDLLVIKVDTF
jgi:hypothetical protein